MDTIEEELEAWKQTVHSLDAAVNRRLARVSEAESAQKSRRGRLTSGLRRLGGALSPKAPPLSSHDVPSSV